MLQRYCLQSATLAVVVRDGQKDLITLEVGAVIEVDASARTSGLVDASWRGEIISLFAEDIRDRGTPVISAVA